MNANTIFAILSAYGFAAETEKIMYWGMGSLMWGDAFTVISKGNDLYAVTVEHWFYDCDGDPVINVHETRILYGAQALAWVFAEMPPAFWRRH